MNSVSSPRLLDRGGSNRGPILLGLASLVLALAPPIGVLARHDLFSAHMLQHLLLLLVTPAFLVLSFRRSATSRRAEFSLWPRAFKAITSPLVTWLAGIGAMWLWHAPALCAAAGSNSAMQAVQLSSLLVCGTLFWWPVLGPVVVDRLPPLWGIAYLFSACAACTLLGIYITFAPTSVCPVYSHGSLSATAQCLEQNWGLTPEVDQQVGGLIMWVPGCVIYLAGALTIMAEWYASEPLPVLPGRRETQTGERTPRTSSVQTHLNHLSGEDPHATKIPGTTA